MKIKITQKDIDKGIGGSCNHCAIAIALKRQFKTDDVYVGVPEGENVMIQINKKIFKIDEGDIGEVDNFIIDFDNYQDYLNLKMHEDDLFGLVKPEPFSFEIEEAR